MEHRLARLLRLEHRGVAGLLEDLLGQVVEAAVGQLDNHRAVVQLLGHAAILARPARSLGRDPHAGHFRGGDLPRRGPALDVGLDALARLVGLVEHGGGADAVEPEGARGLLGGLVGVHVPALGAVHQLVRLDGARGELVLVLLVVLDLQHAALGDRARHDPGDLGVVALRGGDLEAVGGGIVAERVHDLLARRAQRALGQVLAHQVDRRRQGLGLEGQEPRRAGEVVPVGLGIDLDRPALHLGVQHVRAAAEVHDVEHVDVLAQLGLGDLEALAQLANVELGRAAGGVDEDAGQGHETGEALGTDVALAADLGVRLAFRAVARRGGGGEVEVPRVAFDHRDPPAPRRPPPAAGGSRMRARGPRPRTQDTSRRGSP